MNSARIVIAYAPGDHLEKIELEKQLADPTLEIWDSSKIENGLLIEQEIEKKYRLADCVLVLMSGDLFFDAELLKPLLRLHVQNAIRVIPIVLKYYDWQSSVFGGLKVLPADGEPVERGDGQELKRYLTVAREVKKQLAGARSETDIPSLPKNFPLPEHPYVGLTWFQRADAPVFFGRNNEIKKLIGFIRRNDDNAASIIALYGPSGVGKSSLLDAGVLPRLEHEYFITYQRREKATGLAAILRAELDNPAPDQRKRLVILDQVEEIFTNTNPEIPDEKERFVQLLRHSVATRPDWKFVLGFRKEYLSDLEKLVYGNGLDWFRLDLGPLERESLLEAIVGVAREERLVRRYGLKIEPDLPYMIAADILRDKDSHMAPLLQILLRKLWDAEAPKAAGERLFDTKLYDQFRETSLDGLLSTQLEQLKKTHPADVESGLALDLLHFFCTESLTSAQWPPEKLLECYGHIGHILDLKEALQRLYLLAEAPNRRHTRLSHDALARLVSHTFNHSEAPGPKITRLLAYAGSMNVLLTRESTQLAEASRHTRRKFSPAEEEVLEKSLHEHYPAILKDMVGQNHTEGAFHLFHEIISKDGALQDNVQNALLVIQSHFNYIKQRFAKGVLSYAEYTQANAGVRQDLIGLINNLNVAQKTADLQGITLALCLGNLQEALEKSLVFAKKQGDLKELDKINLLFSQWVEVDGYYHQTLTNTETYFLDSSRISENLLDYVRQVASDFKTQEAPDFLSHFFYMHRGDLLKSMPGEELMPLLQSFSSRPNNGWYSTEVLQAVFLFCFGENKYIRGLIYNEDYAALLKKLNHIGNGIIENQFSRKRLREQWQKREAKTSIPGHELLNLLLDGHVEAVYNGLADILEQSGSQQGRLDDLTRIADRYVEANRAKSFLSMLYDDYMVSFNKFVSQLYHFISEHELQPVADTPLDLPNLHAATIEKLNSGELDEALNAWLPYLGNPLIDTLAIVSAFATKNNIAWHLEQGLISFRDFLPHRARIAKSLYALSGFQLTDNSGFSPSMETVIASLSDITFEAGIQFIADAETEKALLTLYKFIIQNNIEKYIGDINLFLKRFYRVQEDYVSGILRHDHYFLEISRITDAVIQIWGAIKS